MDLRRLQVNTKMNGWIEIVNSLGIDIGKKKCRAALKDERAYRILHQWQRGNLCPYPKCVSLWKMYSSTRINS
jgi:hypothetical protein